MSCLLDYGLVRKIGPYENSGLYELTEKGQIAVKHRETYYEDGVDFDTLVERELASSEDSD